MAAAFLIFCGSACITLTAAGTPAGAASNAVATPFECRWTDHPVTIDGKRDEKAWGFAQVIDDFRPFWLGPNAPRPKAATRARLLWDREYLYFYAELDDGDLFADITEPDGMTWFNDVFELFFRPAADKPGYYEFQVTPNGTRMDMFIPKRSPDAYEKNKSAGTFRWDTKVVVRGTLNQRHDRDEGWSVEGRIPWTDFLRTGGRPEPGETWTFALCRYDYRLDTKEPELSTCAPLGAIDYHRIEDYAPLKFVGAADSAGAIPLKLGKRVPLTSSTVVGSPDPPPPYRTRRVFPNLKINYPIIVRPQPGSDWLWTVGEPSPYAPSKTLRFRADPAVATTEVLLDNAPGVVYDICFHPKFLENGYVYLGLNEPRSKTDPVKVTRVTRYKVNPKPPHEFDPKSATVIIEWPSDGHNGGAIAFGHDGMMYVTSGDGTSDSDTNVVGQDLSKLLAKVLRIDVDHPDPGKTYSVPKDNPFVDMPNARPETWAYGLRNPWRMTVDEKTGHLWVAQNGQDQYEQAYFVRKGDNYGWSVMEGSHPFYLSRKPGPTPFVSPTIEHPHSEARSLTGGFVYYGKRFPELQGVYLYGDYSTGKIWGARHDGTRLTWHRELAATRHQITGIAPDHDGEILVCDHRGDGLGGFFTFEATPRDLPPSTFPKTLSASGLFKSVKGHIVQDGVIPYSVAAPFWSDGAHKERYLALPAGTQIDYTRSRGWNFPDKTVVIKSFAYDLEEGNPATRRWIETRFLTNQQGEWYGYSYRWNEAQTDAELVPSEGLTVTIPIKVKPTDDNPSGQKLQAWRYPSRVECMTCHTRASNYVLGLCEVQMNKEHDYGDGKLNQLALLERLGMLKMGNWVADARAALKGENRPRGASDQELDAYLAGLEPQAGQRAAPPSTMLAFAPEKYKRLVDPYDTTHDLTARAKSFLHANCSNCHVEAGGGNAQMELEFTTPLARMRIVDVKPVHDTFRLPEARLVAPGHPERSVLLYRVSTRQAGHMPPLATTVVDTKAVNMLTEWIRQLPPSAAHADRK